MDICDHQWTLCHSSDRKDHMMLGRFVLAAAIFLVVFGCHLAPINASKLQRPKRWAWHEIQKCGKIQGYSCMNHSMCQEKYGREDMMCFEVYPCLSSCIFAAQLMNMELLKQHIKQVVYDGIPLNTHPDPVGYIRSMNQKTGQTGTRGWKR
ncbi:hypothetical protein CSKR_104772 [Clonorchis sinensis]|uniref:Uncharacterized protein n=2 Tax=Clonorchis sinensis TaxID=79923 RepID=A0A8T1M1T6_CLOSI|nr:hypothetical protein CSKR_104772 [Clonorchis sinensis]GAA52890.1 hypothetical protein CLF_109043 [Clonorchis sinensis]